jgi:hypothetical protein
LIWELPGGELLHSIRAARGTLEYSMPAPDCRWAVSGAGGIETAPTVWDLGSGERVTGIDDIVPNRGSQYGLEYVAATLSPDGRFFVAGVEEEVVVWEIAAGREVLRLGAAISTPTFTARMWGHNSSVSSVALSPNGRLVASSDGEKVILWDLTRPSGAEKAARTGMISRSDSQEIHSFGGFNEVVHTLAFVDHGRKILCVSHNRMRIFDVSEGVTLCEIDRPRAFATKASYSADGRWVCAVDELGHLKLWDTHAGAPVAAFLGEAPIRASGVSADGSFLVAGEATGNIHLLALEIAATADLPQEEEIEPTQRREKRDRPKEQERAPADSVQADRSLEESLTPGARLLCQRIMETREEYVHEQLGLHHAFLALLVRHGAMVETLAPDLDVKGQKQRLWRLLGRGDLGDKLDLEALGLEALRVAQAAGKGQASERDVAVAVLRMANLTVHE